MRTNIPAKMNFRMVFSFGCGIDRKSPTLARIEQHAFKRKCRLALNSIANKYWSNRESNDYQLLVRTDLANRSNERSTGQNTRIRSRCSIFHSGRGMHRSQQST
jgi:hypothetical protein